MIEPSRLDDKDRKVIHRCRKFREKLAEGSLPSIAMFQVWLGVGLWVIGIIVLGGLLVVKGSGSLPRGTGESLIGGLVWIGCWYVLAKTQARQEEMIRLICKLADAIEVDRPLNADRWGRPVPPGN
jgi:hypothetical protein